MASRLHSYTLRRTLRVIGVVILSLVAVIALGFVFVEGLSITRVEVDGQGMTIELDKSKLGGNLLLIPTARLTQELLSEYPLLSSVRFEKRFPGTLIIHLTKRQPFAVLSSDNISYIVDREGVVLGNAAGDATYPVMQFDVGPVVIGGKLTDTNVQSSLAILGALYGVVPISRLSSHDSTSIQAVMGNTNIFFPQTGDMKAKADTLQTIVEGFRIKGTLPTVIDLRFDKPIVTN